MLKKDLGRVLGKIGCKIYKTNLSKKLLGSKEILALTKNINCEPSGIAGLALFLLMKDKIPRNKKILTVNTKKSKF